MAGAERHFLSGLDGSRGRPAGDRAARRRPVPGRTSSRGRARGRIPIRAGQCATGAVDQYQRPVGPHLCAGVRASWQVGGAKAYNLTVKALLKGTLLYLANRRPVHRLVMQHDLLRGLTQRYVAGEELADGIVVAETLNTQGLLVSLDHLGESVTNPAEARRAVSAYVEALEAIAAEQVEGNISLKLTQLGLDLSREMCVAHLRTILERASKLNSFVRIDMESSAYTQRTLDVHQELWKDGFQDVGVVLQAYLYRTAADVERAIEQGVQVRLCKGAYLEPPRVAFPDKVAVDANYARLMERLLVAGSHPAIATHDERLLNQALEIARRQK